MRGNEKTTIIAFRSASVPSQGVDMIYRSLKMLIKQRKQQLNGFTYLKIPFDFFYFHFLYLNGESGEI